MTSAKEIYGALSDILYSKSLTYKAIQDHPNEMAHV